LDALEADNNAAPTNTRETLVTCRPFIYLI